MSIFFFVTACVSQSEVLPMCLPVTIAGNALGLDLADKTLLTNDDMYSPEAMNFTDPAMVVAYDCLCGTYQTDFMTKCSAGDTCNQLTGYCIAACKTGSINSKMCSCGSSAGNPVNCAPGQFCVGYDELYSRDDSSHAHQNATVDSDNSNNYWNAESMCVSPCRERQDNANACACGSLFCTQASHVCHEGECMNICAEFWSVGSNAQIVDQPCLCGAKEVCVGNQVCNNGNCIDKCTNNLSDTNLSHNVISNQNDCWCFGAGTLCGYQQICNDGKCIDSCDLKDGTKFGKCRCNEKFCETVEGSFRYCLASAVSDCIKGCDDDSRGSEQCRCAKDTCKSEEKCHNDKCIPQCPDNKPFNEGKCWCGEEPDVCDNHLPVCRGGKCRRF